MTDLILHPAITEMFKDMEGVFTVFDIDYYVVGAVARDIHLSADSGTAAIRKTNDVDLAISVNDAGHFNQLKQALITTGKFTAHSTDTIKLFYKNAIEVDLLPFGQIEATDRKVTLNDPLFILNMPGFLEIYPFVNIIQVTTDLSIKVCTMEGIILLKLISNNDRPQRTKDIADIEHVIAVYFDLYSSDIYDENFDTMELYDTSESDYLQLVCSRVIGRKMGKLLSQSPALKTRISGILEKRTTKWWQAMLDGLAD